MESYDNTPVGFGLRQNKVVISDHKAQTNLLSSSPPEIEQNIFVDSGRNFLKCQQRYRENCTFIKGNVIFSSPSVFFDARIRYALICMSPGCLASGTRNLYY
jgi:hypothetical protein